MSRESKQFERGDSTSSNRSELQDSKGVLFKRKDYLDTDEKAKSHPNRTYYYKRHHNLDEVIETCTKKLQDDPKNLKALYIRGSSYFKKGNLELAIKDLSLVLTHQSDHLECLYSRGIALFKMGKHDEAVEDLSLVLKHNPDHINAAFARAACYNKMGMLSQAIEDYNFALFKDDAINSPDTKNNSGNNTIGRTRTFSGSNSMESPFPLNKSGYDSSMFSPGNSVHGGGEGTRSKRLESLDASGIFSLYENNNPGSSQRPSSRNTNISFNDSRYSDSPPPMFSPERYKASNQSRPSTANSNEGGGGGNGFSFKSFSEIKAQGLNNNNSGNNNSSYNRRPSFAGSEYSSNSMGRSSSDFKSPPNPNNLSMSSTSPVPLFNAAGPNSANSRNSKPTSTTPPPNDDFPPPSIIADKLHAKGYELRKKGDYHGAIEEYSKALQYDQKHFKSLFNRAFAFDKINKFERAIEDYTNAIQLDRVNAFCYYNRGITYDHMNQLPLALQDFNKAIELSPYQIDFYHNRAYCYRKIGQIQLAIKDYTTVLNTPVSAIPPPPSTSSSSSNATTAPTITEAQKNFKAFYNRSICYEQINQLHPSLQDINHAIELQSNHAPSFAHRALIHEKLNLLPNAILDLTKAIQCGASLVTTLYSRSKIYIKLNNYHKALEDLSRIIETTPQSLTKQPFKDINILFSRAMCYKSLNLYNEAINDFNHILSIDSSQLSVYTYRGYCYRKLEKNKEAIDDYSMVIRLDPMNVRAYNNRGFLYAKLQMFEEAIQDYTNAIELDPMNSHAYHNRGISYDKIGMIDQAIADFSKVFELDSKQSTMKLTKEEQSSLFELDNNGSNQRNQNLSASSRPANRARANTYDDNDAASVGSGARYRGNVNPDPNQFPPQYNQPPMNGQRMPIPMPGAPNPYGGHPLQQMRSLSVGRGGSLPSGNNFPVRSMSGSPMMANTQPYSPPPNGSRPMTAADLNPGSSPIRVPQRVPPSGNNNPNPHYSYNSNQDRNPPPIQNSLTRSSSYGSLSNPSPLAREASTSSIGGGAVAAFLSTGNSLVPPQPQPSLYRRPSTNKEGGSNPVNASASNDPNNAPLSPALNRMLAAPFSPHRPAPVALPGLSNRVSISNDVELPLPPSTIIRAFSTSTDNSKPAQEANSSNNNTPRIPIPLPTVSAQPPAPVPARAPTPVLPVTSNHSDPPPPSNLTRQVSMNLIPEVIPDRRNYSEDKAKSEESSKEETSPQSIIASNVPVPTIFLHKNASPSRDSVFEENFPSPVPPPSSTTVAPPVNPPLSSNIPAVVNRASPAIPLPQPEESAVGNNKIPMVVNRSSPAITPPLPEESGGGNKIPMVVNRGALNKPATSDAANSEESRANKVKALTQRFNVIKSAVTSEPAEGNKVTNTFTIGGGNESNQNGSNHNIGIGGRIAVPTAFSQSKNDPSSSGTGGGGAGKIAIPSLKRPSLFRPPVPVPTPTESSAASTTSNTNAGDSNMKAESFLAMLKPPPLPDHDSESNSLAEAYDHGHGDDSDDVGNGGSGSNFNKGSIPLPIPGKFSRPNIYN